MRLIAVVTLLLLTATGVAAQEAAELEPRPVNWLCDNAFVQAELLAATAVATPADGEDPAPEAVAAASPSAPPELDAGSPEPTFLDEAIRACSSVDDFTAGAALHPDLLGDIEPVAWLQARCAEAELADYSTCVSLIHALATPAPTARPTPAPRSTGKARPKATAAPRTDSRKRQRDDGKVAVPAVRAKVPGATRVQYFDIRGKTWSALNRSTARQTARLCENHQARACLETRISSVRPLFRQNRSSGSCTLTGVKANLTTVAHMPRWSVPQRVSPALAWVWRKSIARTGWHEAQHAKIAKRHFRRLPKLVAGKPCSRFAAITKRWWKQMTRAQNKFDRVDYRKSAAVHARWFRRANERFR